MEKLVTLGWVCPLCGRVYSPTTIMCSHCVPVENNIRQEENDRCRNEVPRSNNESRRFA